MIRRAMFCKRERSWMWVEQFCHQVDIPKVIIGTIALRQISRWWVWCIPPSELPTMERAFAALDALAAIVTLSSPRYGQGLLGPADIRSATRLPHQPPGPPGVPLRIWGQCS